MSGSILLVGWRFLIKILWLLPFNFYKFDLLDNICNPFFYFIIKRNLLEILFPLSLRPYPFSSLNHCERVGFVPLLPFWVLGERGFWRQVSFRFGVFISNEHYNYILVSKMTKNQYKICSPLKLGETHQLCLPCFLNNPFFQVTWLKLQPHGCDNEQLPTSIFPYRFLRMAVVSTSAEWLLNLIMD